MALDLIEVAELFVSNIQKSVLPMIKKDGGTIYSFVQDQAVTIGKYAASVAGLLESNQFTDKEKQYYLSSLDRSAMSFANTLVSMIAIEAEKIWNAVVKAIWETLGAVLKTAFAFPAFKP